MRKPVTAKIREEAQEWARPWFHDPLLENAIRTAFLGGAKFCASGGRRDGKCGYYGISHKTQQKPLIERSIKPLKDHQFVRVVCLYGLKYAQNRSY